MNDDIRRQALRATAKIALSLTVIGCGGTVDVAGSSQTVTDEPNEPIEDPLEPQPNEPHPDGPDAIGEVTFPEQEEEALVCDAPPVGDEVAILDGGKLDCCMDFLEPTWPEPTAEGWEQWQTAMQDPDIGACCNVVTAHVGESAEPLADVTWDQFQNCCVATGFAQVACTPWGPPVPPAWDGALTSLDALELA
jgi:hypothetical protein